MRSRPPEPVSISDRLIKQVGELTPSHHQIRRVARRISPTTRYSHHTTPSYRLKSAEHVPPDKSLGKHSPKPATALARNDHPISLPPPKSKHVRHPSLPPATHPLQHAHSSPRRTPSPRTKAQHSTATMPTHTSLPIPKPSRRSKAIYPAPKPARRPQPGPTRTPAPCAPQRVAAARDGQVTCDRCACAGGKRERRVQRQGCRPTLACCTPGWGLPCLARPAPLLALASALALVGRAASLWDCCVLVMAGPGGFGYVRLWICRCYCC